MASAPPPTNILFITSSRIGDAVLSTGLIDHLIKAHPHAQITIVCGNLAAPLFEGVPNLDEIISVEKQTYNRHWLYVWKKTIFKKWNVIVDLRDSAVSRLVLGGRRYIHSRHIDKSLHKVEQNAMVMRLSQAPAPRLWFTKDQSNVADEATRGHDHIIAVAPTANWIGKTWPVGNFIQVVRTITGEKGGMAGASVAVFAAPGEEEGARVLLDTIPEGKRIDAIGRYDPAQAAAILSRTNFFIGNDSGLMHCAAACGVRTLGLFGPSYPQLYRPWGDHCDFVSTHETFDMLIDFDGYNPKTLDHSLMSSLSVEAVLDKINQMQSNP